MRKARTLLGGSLKDQFREAMSLHRAGETGRAELVYRDLLRHDPEHAGAWHCLGLVLHSRRNLPDALAHLEKAISLCDSKAAYWNNYGAVLRDAGRARKAKEAFERAIALRDSYADAWSNLGLIQMELGDLDGAEGALHHALRLTPRHADAMRHLAGLCLERRGFAEALSWCRQAAAHARNKTQAYELEGRILAAMGRFDKAAEAYGRAIAIDATSPSLHLERGRLYIDLGETERARKEFVLAARLRPERPTWQRRHLTLCPSIVQTEEEVAEYRVRLEQQLDEALADPPDFDWRRALEDGFTPSFQLAFHGVCNRRIKEKFARLFAASFPREPIKPRNQSKIRIGFVCTRSHEGGFLRGFGSLMQRLNRRRFEVVGLVSDTILSTCRESVRCNDVQWLGFPHHLERAWRTIRSAECDVIVHWHAGSDVLNYFLPFLPLAPRQCIGFGANGTTGIPTIDYFLSSRLFEREHGAEEDYAERLVRFRGLTTFQQRPPIPQPATRRVFGLPASGVLYFCPQQLGKFDPRFDVSLRRILEESPGSHLVVLSGRRARAARALQTRFDRTLGPGLSNRVIFLPFQRPREYYRLLGLSDVVLDAPTFSASLTGLDSFSLGRPVVTMPGPLMAQRYALGFYTLMGISDLPTWDEEAYVDLAVSLGADRDFRQHVTERILARNNVLFENRDVVEEYESFFHAAVRGPTQPEVFSGQSNPERARDR